VNDSTQDACLVLATSQLSTLAVQWIHVTVFCHVCMVIFTGREESYLLGCNTVQSIESQVTVWRNLSPPSSGSKNKPSKRPV
jgi:hypothetical protein